MCASWTSFGAWALNETDQAARRAVALDDASAPAHMALGTVHIWAEQTELGLAEAMRALELNPNFAHAAMAVGNRLDLVGRGEEGIAQMERALELNPRDPNRWRYMAYLARAWLSLGDPERAAEWSRQAIMLLFLSLGRSSMSPCTLGSLGCAGREVEHPVLELLYRARGQGRGRFSKPRPRESTNDIPGDHDTGPCCPSLGLRGQWRQYDASDLVRCLHAASRSQCQPGTRRVRVPLGDSAWRRSVMDVLTG